MTRSARPDSLPCGADCLGTATDTGKLSLTTGTRDLFLSNTVRTHRKLRRAGVEADLNVYEGQSHAQYMFDPDVPETKEAIGDIAAFFDRHLGVK